MKTNWKSGDIITADKINNIIKNSLDSNFICLNDYSIQGEYESPIVDILDIKYQNIQAATNNNNKFVYYVTDDGLFIDINWLDFSSNWTFESNPDNLNQTIVQYNAGGGVMIE